MKVAIKTILFLALAIAANAASSDIVETFILDYPHGGQRIMVTKSGEAYLFYGAAPQAKIIKKGAFSVEDLFRTFQDKLHPNIPRENWPDPQSRYGMVTVRYTGGEEEDYLIFDVDELAKDIFNTADRNIVGDIW